MNISEIRKKAQQEKAESGFPASPRVTTGPMPETAGEAKRKEPTLSGGDLRSELEEPIPSNWIDMPPGQGFDPLAAIMAGRAAAATFDGASRHTDSPPEEDAGESGRLLCFRVAGEFYGVDIMEIREIIRPRAVTEVPRMPSFVSGVLSLRGVMVPVFDMRMRLGHAAAGDTGKERIVVLKRGEELGGLLVDEVTQVAAIDPASFEPPPAVLDGIDRDFVMGIGRIEGRMLILLNLESILDMNLH